MRMTIREMYGPWGGDEIARYLRVQRSTVDMWRQRGVLPNPDGRISGRPWYWPDRIDTWAADSDRIPTFPIMVSDGSEGEDGSEAAWLVVDDEDSCLDQIPHRSGDTIHDAIGRMVERGMLPPVRMVEREEISSPYPWQIQPYRWQLEQIHLPRSAREWADALDALTRATGWDAGTLTPWAYASGGMCWVPVDPDSPDADDERGVLVSGCGWIVRYDPQSRYWVAA
jgi:hypothetical protein